MRLFGDFSIGNIDVGYRVGWSPLLFSLIRLRLMDMDNECPGMVSIVEVGTLGFYFEIWYQIEGSAF